MINKSLCVSCYNREREVVLGKDRNGHKPKLQLRAVEYVVADNKIVRIMTASTVEIFADAYLGGYAFFCWASHPVIPEWSNPLPMQSDLFGGGDYLKQKRAIKKVRMNVV